MKEILVSIYNFSGDWLAHLMESFFLDWVAAATLEEELLSKKPKREVECGSLLSTAWVGVTDTGGVYNVYT